MNHKKGKQTHNHLHTTTDNNPNQITKKQTQPKKHTNKKSYTWEKINHTQTYTQIHAHTDTQEKYKIPRDMKQN